MGERGTRFQFEGFLGVGKRARHVAAPEISAGALRHDTRQILAAQLARGDQPRAGGETLVRRRLEIGADGPTVFRR